MPDKSPPPLAWSIQVAREATRFFSLNEDVRVAVLHDQQIEVPANTFVAFSVQNFIVYLQDRGVETTGRRTTDLVDLLARMAGASILFEERIGAGRFFDRRYVLGPGITRLQRPGGLWMAPVIGPEVIIAIMAPNVAHITGTTPDGDVHGGSGLLIDTQHVLTAAHVVEDMTLDQTVWFSGEHEANVREVVFSDKVRDVALLRVDLPKPVSDSRISGLAFRDPQWSDRVTIMGYPPVPTTIRPHQTVQSGEVVNPDVQTSQPGEWFLFSAVARPGNSGGPVIGADGRVLGLVTREFSAESERVASPFFAGVPTSSIVDALEEFSLGGLLPVEDWT